LGEKLTYENALTKRFIYKVTEDGLIYPQYETFPEIYGKVLNYFISIYYNTPLKVQQVIDQIREHRERENNKEFLGANDTTFLVNGESTTFYTEYVSELPPITLSTNHAIEFFSKYKEWLIKFEAGKIIGLTVPPNKNYKIVRTSHEPIKINEIRTVKLKGNFFIKATRSLNDVADQINKFTNLNLKKDKTGYYEEIPAFTNNFNLVEFALLGIPDEEFRMQNKIYDCYNFIVRDNSKESSNEWLNYGRNIMSTLKTNTELECYE